PGVTPATKVVANICATALRRSGRNGMSRTCRPRKCLGGAVTGAIDAERTTGRSCLHSYQNRWKRIPHGFRDAVRAVSVPIAIITASADVEVLSAWEAQTCQSPLAVSRLRAIAQGSVAHIVGRVLESNAREWRGGAAEFP